MSSLPSYSRRHGRPTFDLDAPFRSAPSSSPFSIMGPFRAAFRILLIFLWGLCCFLIQCILLPLPFGLKVRFPRVFWRGVCRILHIEVRQAGHIAGRCNVGLFKRNHIKPILFAANHTTWIDIAILGKILPTLFISKTSIRKWPLIGTLTRSGGTIYLSKEPQKTKAEVELISQRMTEGYNITLFPEGTTTSGTMPLPFLSSIFALACPHLGKSNKNVTTPLVQPVSILFDRLEGLPVGKSRRISVFSWFGDMEFIPHLWQLLKWKHMRVTVMFHEPLDPTEFKTRKALSVACREIIRHGVDVLKQGRENIENFS